VADPPSPTGVEAPAEVVVSDDQDAVPLDAARWADLAGAVLSDRGCSGELTLAFVDEATISELNLEHMGAVGPTDVLSFPLDDPAERTGPDSPPMLIGDVVICPAVAERQFAEHAGTLDDELALLVVHGVLHVLGHDHAEPEEARDMRELERLLLERHHWSGSAPVDFSSEHRS